MNINDRYIVELARAAIFDETPRKPEGEINWKFIFRKANEQNIMGLLCCAVNKMDEENQPD